LIFEGKREDVLVFPTRIWDKETPYDMIVRLPTFFTREYHLYRDDVRFKRSISRAMPRLPVYSTASCWSS
jgi:hypothetical protein